MMAPRLVYQILGGLIRLALTSVFTWMIQRGIIADGDVEPIVTGIAGIVLIAGWTAFQKLNAWEWLQHALSQPPGTTVEEMVDDVKRYR